MNTLTISLPDDLLTFIDTQVEAHRDADRSAYVCDVLLREQQRVQLRERLLAGANSPIVDAADAAYFAKLRARAALDELARIDQELGL